MNDACCTLQVHLMSACNSPTHARSKVAINIALQRLAKVDHLLTLYNTAVQFSVSELKCQVRRSVI